MAKTWMVMAVKTPRMMMMITTILTMVQTFAAQGNQTGYLVP